MYFPQIFFKLMHLCFLLLSSESCKSDSFYIFSISIPARRKKNIKPSFCFAANIMYSTLGMADSDETRNSSRPRGTERQQEQQAEQENQGEEQQAGRGPQDEEAVRRRTAENGYAATDRDAGFTDEWAQQRDQRVMRRRDQVRIFSAFLKISLFLVL